MSSAPTPTATSAGYQRELIRPTARRRFQWQAETWIYAGLEGVLRVLPAIMVAKIGRTAGGLACAVLPKRRRVVERNLRIAFSGEYSREQLHAMTTEVFRRAGANLLGSLRTAHVDEATLMRSVEVKNKHLFDEALAKGKGVVVVIAHMGNWEAMAQWGPKWLPPGKSAANVYRPLNNPIMNERVLKARIKSGMVMFSKDESPLTFAAHLRTGGILGIMSDQRAGMSGEIVPFFGRLTSCTPIPAVLARRTHAEVLGVSLRTLSPGRWELKMHSLEGEPTTSNVMALLERVMRESAPDVFWLQDRWKVDGTTPHVTNGKVPRGTPVEPVVTKPRRVAVWLEADDLAPLRLPEPKPDDVALEFCLPAGIGRPSWLPTGAEVHDRSAGEKFAALVRADAAAALPLDFVYARRPDAELKRAARKLGLPVLFVKESEA